MIKQFLNFYPLITFENESHDKANWSNWTFLLSSALILGEDLNSCGIVVSNPQAKQLYDHKALQ